MGNLRPFVLGAGGADVGVPLAASPGRCSVGAGATADWAGFFVLALRVPGRVSVLGGRIGFLDTATLVAAFCVLAFLPAERAMVFFRVASPAAFTAERAPAFALAAAARSSRLFFPDLAAAAFRGRVLAALREAVFRGLAVLTTPPVSSERSELGKGRKPSARSAVLLQGCGRCARGRRRAPSAREARPQRRLPAVAE